MIYRSKIASRRRLITHDNCPDGIASAWIWAAMVPDLEVVFCQYNTEQHRTLEARDGDVFCDFSPHPSRIEAHLATDCLVLDHHATTREVVERFGDNGMFGSRPGECGAALAYQVYLTSEAAAVQGNTNLSFIEAFVMRVGVRDTYQRSSPFFREASEQAEALVFFGADHWIRAAKNEGFSGGRVWLLDSERDVGRALYEKKHRDVVKADRESTRIYYCPGVVFFNELKVATDLADYIRESPESKNQDAKVLACFEYKGDPNDEGKPKLIFTLRALKDSIDVGAFCKTNGGGGHAGAAGFVLSGEDESPPFIEFEAAMSRAKAAGTGW